MAFISLISCTPTQQNQLTLPKTQARAAFITFVVACMLAALTVASAYTNFTHVGSLPHQLHFGLNAFATQMFLASTCAAALLTLALLACRHQTMKIIQRTQLPPEQNVPVLRDA
jgi:hypothetical protein